MSKDKKTNRINNFKGLIIVSLVAVTGVLLIAAIRAAGQNTSFSAGLAATTGRITKCNSDDYVVFGVKCDGSPISNSTGEKNRALEQFRHNDPIFSRYADVPSDQLSWEALTVPSGPDNGPESMGQFRVVCQYSHLSYDDPIVYPGQEEAAHLHLFFGNTRVNAHTTTDSLVNSGGGSCQGQELNRTGYWMPTLHDAQGRVRIPYSIVVYYKSRFPAIAEEFPQGLQMIAGDSLGIGNSWWSCNDGSLDHGVQDTIPQNCGGRSLHAVIDFPQCWDGKNLKSPDNKSHMVMVPDNQPCPSSHPRRLPQIQELFYWPGEDTTGWYLSSDRHGGVNKPGGSTLHADWYGGWNNFAMKTWTDNCIRKSRNCSIGQTGTSRALSRMNGVYGLNYDGPTVFDIPNKY